MSNCPNCDLIIDYKDPEVIEFYTTITSLDGVRCCHCLELWDFNYYVRYMPAHIKRERANIKNNICVDVVLSMLPFLIDPSNVKNSRTKLVYKELENHFKTIKCASCNLVYETIPKIRTEENIDNKLDSYQCPNCMNVIVNGKIFDISDFSNFYYAISGLPQMKFNLIPPTNRIQSLYKKAFAQGTVEYFCLSLRELMCKLITSIFIRHEVKQLRVLYNNTSRTYLDQINMRFYLRTLERKYKTKLTKNNLKFMLPKNINNEGHSGEEDKDE